ncbi:MAG: hypothetical protein Q7S60_02790 [bacterium]|nr:hypothetical protein [bacterium]
MPRKTRKEKEKAQARSLVNREFEFRLDELNLPEKNEKSSKRIDRSILASTTHSIMPDLIKTVLLAAGIFSLEIVVYLRWFK